MSDRYDTGMATRRGVPGAAHLDAVQAALTLNTEGGRGTVWPSDAIAPRVRSLLALRAAPGTFGGIAVHIRTCARTGARRTDVTDACRHVATCCGVPKANPAISRAPATWNETERAD
jgi:4-carboxymuconolactone decarboxylase